MVPIDRKKPLYPDGLLDDGDYLRDEEAFLSKVNRLIEALRTIEPSRRVEEFDFVAQPDGIYLYPEALKERLVRRELEGVTVTTVGETLFETDPNTKNVIAIEQPPTTTIETFDEDGSLYFSRQSTQPTEEEAKVLATKEEAKKYGDVAFNNSDKSKPIPIPNTPNHELNAFLMSLTGDIIEATTLLGAKVDEPVNASDLHYALSRRALHRKTTIDYELASGHRVQQITNRGLQTELEEFVIFYTTGVGVPMAARINRTKGLSITFEKFPNEHNEAVLSDTIGQVTSLIPDGGDYVRLNEIITDETEILLAASRAQEVTFNDTVLSLDALRAAVSGDDSDENGFDTPDPSAG